MRGDFESYRAVIRTALLQQVRNDKLNAWVEDMTKEYEGKVSYAEGYAPPELPEVPPTTATE